jgi:hypothetical protein
MADFPWCDFYRDSAQFLVISEQFSLIVIVTSLDNLQNLESESAPFSVIFSIFSFVNKKIFDILPVFC